MSKEERLPAVYGNTPPMHSYGSVEELRILEDLEEYATLMHELLTRLLTTFGPKPDLQIAFWQEDFHVFLVHLQRRIEGK